MYAKIEVIGHLGNDPEIRHLQSGTINANFSVATNRPKFLNKSTGEIETPAPFWWRIVCYQTGEKGLVTELIQKWLKKGQLVFVEGEPRIRKYTDKEGIDRQAFEIHLGPQSVIRMLGGERNGNGKVQDPPFESGGPPKPEKGDPGPGDIDLGAIPI